MVSAAIVNAALGGNAAGRAWMLTLAGTDVLKEVGTPGNRFGVPRESIAIQLAGPGGVSSMTFEIDDPLKAITPRKRDQVVYTDLVNNHHEFQGWVSGYTSRPWGLGRRWTVRVDGPEKALDWLFVPSLVIPANTVPGVAIQSIGAAALGVGIPLTWRSADLGDFAGTFMAEISKLSTLITTLWTQYVVTITNQTARQAIETVLKAVRASADPEFYDPNTPTTALVTVDMNLAVRAWRIDTKPDDWTNLTVTDTVAGPLRADGLEADVDVGELPSGVYVTGGNAAGSGLVVLGDGIPGPIIPYSDPAILTATARNAAALAILQEKVAAAVARGEFDLVDFAPPATTIHPGSFLVLTDAETGATGTYRISGIAKTYTGTRETWHVSYGGLRPSLPRAIRRLTRATIS